MHVLTTLAFALAVVAVAFLLRAVARDRQERQLPQGNLRGLRTSVDAEPAHAELHGDPARLDELPPAEPPPAELPSTEPPPTERPSTEPPPRPTIPPIVTKVLTSEPDIPIHDDVPTTPPPAPEVLANRAAPTAPPAPLPPTTGPAPLAPPPRPAPLAPPPRPASSAPPTRPAPPSPPTRPAPPSPLTRPAAPAPPTRPAAPPPPTRPAAPAPPTRPAAPAPPTRLAAPSPPTRSVPPAPAARSVPETPPERTVSPTRPAPVERTALEADDPERKKARRFARLLVSEIKLYNEELVSQGIAARDLYVRLKEPIGQSILAFERRVPEAVRAEFDYIHDELIRQLAGGDASKLGPH